MRNPIENLGDYNVVRDALKAEGGNADKLFSKIGDNAVAKAAPMLQLKGGIFGSLVTVILVFGCIKVWQAIGKRKLAIKNEPNLKAELFDKHEENSKPKIINDYIVDERRE